jgi:prepilin-type N-terminal cleavage/methylation domain-containing protein
MRRRGENVVRRRNGFTLVETLIVVVLLGLMGLIAFPKMSAAMVRSDLRSARTTMVNLMAAARAASVQSNRLTWIEVEGNKAYVLASPRLAGPADGVADTVGAVRDFTALYGVTLTDATGDIQFDPRGFGVGFGTVDSIVLARSGYSSTITIDGLGRVLK